MKMIMVLLVALVMVFGFAAQSQASLTVIGSGTITSDNGGTGAGVGGTYQLIYDSGQNITWLDYSAPSATWQNQVNWASNLVVNFNGQNLTGWSLPTTVDGPNVWAYDGSTAAGYNITSSEMGYLYYTDLGNKGYFDTSGNSHPGGQVNTGPFQNLMSYYYWSETKLSSNPNEEWEFYFYYPNPADGASGSQNASFGSNPIAQGLAVLQGDPASTPIPATAYMFGSGLLGLVGLRKKMRR